MRPVNVRHRVPEAAIPRCFSPIATIQYHFHYWRCTGFFVQMIDELRARGRELIDVHELRPLL